jgi:N-acetylglucosaminyl-diphospho-decaprenol L-rhamnosyltransferase
MQAPEFMSDGIHNDNPTCLLIVIVNYRTPNLTINCLHSLVSEVSTVPATKVVVVDNDSGDRSIAQISDAIAQNGWENWASLLPSARNGGYAYGNNLVIRSALQSSAPPPYFLLLNPDSEVRSGALKALIDFMGQNPNVGIAGSSFEGPEGKPWLMAFRFPTVWSELDSGLRLGIVSKLLSNWIIPCPMTDRACQVDWLPGASMIVRREVFESIGLMDEEYFLYFEETDFCLHAKRAGWSCWYVPQSRVMHLAGQSTGVTLKDGNLKRRPQYWFESRQRYFIKNHGVLYAAIADTAWILGFILWQFRRVLQGKPNGDPPQFLRDFIRNSVFLKTSSVTLPEQKLEVHRTVP